MYRVTDKGKAAILEFMQSDHRPSCYECGERVDWLAPDGRCGDCTRLTPGEVAGDEH